jgi:hypothetical protein
MNTRPQVKVIRKADRAQHVVSAECKCATISVEELLRRFNELRRAVKSFEAFANKQGLDLKSE